MDRIVQIISTVVAELIDIPIKKSTTIPFANFSYIYKYHCLSARVIYQGEFFHSVVILYLEL